MTSFTAKARVETELSSLASRFPQGKGGLVLIAVGAWLNHNGRSSFALHIPRNEFMPSVLLRRFCILAICLLANGLQGTEAPVFANEPLEYRVVDDDLEVILLDSSPKDSFLSVQADTLGRLFVGGREALFVYEPKDDGGYYPRQEIYRFPDHTWIYEIAIRGNDIYVITVSALYVIPDAVTNRSGLKAKRLVWGVPLGHVHQCFHGMAIGPEGDIYFAMGDPLWYYGDFTRPDHWGHWTFFSQPKGTRMPHNGVGGVFRCKPDGSNFQVVARGLRNSCGLAFDRH